MRPDLMTLFYCSGGLQAATVAAQAPPLQYHIRQYGGVLSRRAHFDGPDSISFDNMGGTLSCNRGFICRYNGAASL